ncbi:uncharacterized protein CEXT_11841, partial [Caerostris extrusa]
RHKATQQLRYIVFIQIGMRKSLRVNKIRISSSCKKYSPHLFQVAPADRPVCEMLKDYTDEGNVVLSCRSSANPAAFNFSWFRNNDSIFSETRESNRQESIIALSGSNPNVRKVLLHRCQ